MSTAIQQFRGDNNLLAQAEMLAKANIVPKAFRGKPADVLAAILWGDELGLGPMAAMNFIDIIDGNPTLNTEGRVALVRRAGHSIQITATATQATAHGKRRDTGDEQTVTWTMEMAKRAKLSGKQVWQAYPEAMLTSRAVSQLTRNLFPDVTGGFSYAAEEVASFAAPELMDQPEALVRGAVGSTGNAEQGTPALATAAPQSSGEGGPPQAAPSPVEVVTTSPPTSTRRTSFPAPTKAKAPANDVEPMTLREAQQTAKRMAEPVKPVDADPMVDLTNDLRERLLDIPKSDAAYYTTIIAKWGEAKLPNATAPGVVLTQEQYDAAIVLVQDAEEAIAGLEAPFSEPSLLDGGDAA